MILKTNKHKCISFLSIFIPLLCITLSVVANDNHPQKQKLTPAEALKFDYFFYEGLRLKNAEKIDASFEMFRHCLDIDSTSSAALYELSSYYIYFEQPEKAISLMKKAVAYAPDNHDYRGALATLLFNLDMFGEAADEYEILVKAYPDRTDLNFYLAEVYTRMGEIGKAIDLYDELENVMGMHEVLSMQKYRLYATLEQQENAISEIKKIADKSPTEPRYPIMLGDLYLQQNETALALQYYEKAREIDPESPHYPVSMANYYEKTGQRDSAKQQINAALVNERLDIDTKLSILTRYINQLRYSKQDIDGANVLFEMLLDQHPDDSRLKLVYGSALIMQKKYDEAQFQIKIVTESEPENIEAWVQLLQLSVQIRDFDEVVRICEKCQEIFPKMVEFYYYMGVAHYQRKDFQSAVDTYLNAISQFSTENVSDLSDFYGQLGDAYFKLREIDKSFNAYEEALKYNDRNLSVLNNYAYYLSLLKKDLSKAERMSAITVKMAPESATFLDTYAWIFFMQGNLLLAKLYIELAISKDNSNSAELLDHYGDILYQSGEKEKALIQWKKARELGKISATIDKKIAQKTYFEATEDELLSDSDEDSNDTLSDQ